jgi:hypothetical protein
MGPGGRDLSLPSLLNPSHGSPPSLFPETLARPAGSGGPGAPALISGPGSDLAAEIVLTPDSSQRHVHRVNLCTGKTSQDQIHMYTRRLCSLIYERYLEERNSQSHVRSRAAQEAEVHVHVRVLIIIIWEQIMLNINIVFNAYNINKCMIQQMTEYAGLGHSLESDEYASELGKLSIFSILRVKDLPNIYYLRFVSQKESKLLTRNTHSSLS